MFNSFVVKLSWVVCCCYQEYFNNSCAYPLGQLLLLTICHYCFGATTGGRRFPANERHRPSMACEMSGAQCYIRVHARAEMSQSVQQRVTAPSTATATRHWKAHTAGETITCNIKVPHIVTFGHEILFDRAEIQKSRQKQTFTSMYLFANSHLYDNKTERRNMQERSLRFAMKRSCDVEDKIDLDAKIQGSNVFTSVYWRDVWSRRAMPHKYQHNFCNFEYIIDIYI